MRVCSHALSSVNPLNSCCLSVPGGYESDDKQSCEDYGSGTTENKSVNHRKNSLLTCSQDNGSTQYNELSNSIENLANEVDSNKNRIIVDDKINDNKEPATLNLTRCQTSPATLDVTNCETSPATFDSTNCETTPATLNVTSCETLTAKLNVTNKNDFPRHSCPPRIMSSDFDDESDEKDYCESATNKSTSKDTSPDSCGSHTTGIPQSILIANSFENVDTDSSDQNFVEVSLFGSSPPKCINAEEESAYTEQGAKPKKKGIGNFFTRNLFPRLSGGKSKKASAASGAVVKEEWTPFGRMQVKDMPDNQQKGFTHPPTGSTSWKNRQASLGVASSTTALIFENRPFNLPAKNPEEEQKHRHMYEQMVKEAKKKEKELAKQLAKDHVQQTKLDQKVQNSLTTWNKDILPNFDAVRSQKKTRELWWNGIPPSVRGKVWIMAIGNELNITDELFEIFKERARDTLKSIKEPDAEKVHKASRESSMELIKLDVSRTFPHLCIFQKGGPYHNMLHSILGAYACYRPDVGYVQGMSFIAAVFLLNLEPPNAFLCFSNLMNKPCQMAFFRLDQTIMQAYFATFEEYFQDNLPQLFVHFEELEVTPDLYIIDWMYTLYSKSLPLDVACRVWDVFFRDGEEFLFRTALGILQLYRNILLEMDFIHIAQFLTKLPETIASGSLFKSIAAIDIHQKKFGHVLASHLTRIQQQQTGGTVTE
ncbi:TBC1 domain family member 12-like [Antedon mediterranea]|uniref:TBC1 domain family member 12-like n=1 Tax=Antedon mediterranea TaxID=105859 RepID=UPI003AF9E9AC